MTKLSRRRFLQSSAVASAASVLPARILRPFGANDRLALGFIGVGGKGWSDLEWIGHDQDVVALCDVDANNLGRARAKYGAQTYRDWRALLDQKNLQAVVISAPDHTHAPAAMAAMQRGLHVYVQKPLTHSVFEARQLRLMAQKSGVVTQMGNQHRSGVHQKGAKALLQQGAIGKVRSAHCWTDRPIWPQGIDRPAGEDPVPPTLAWDLWLGAAPTRPFKNGVYHGFKWRGFWDFGTGALGDMGCHLMDPVLWMLDLPAPTAVWAEGPPVHADTAPTWMIVHYEFALPDGETFELTWYDGKKLPPHAATLFPADKKIPPNGALFVGEKGTLFCSDGAGPWLHPKEAFADHEMPEVKADDHYQQFVAACKGEAKCVSHFASAAHVTETVLLGNVAYRTGKRIEWDADKLEARGVPEAAPFLRRDYRAGWETQWLDIPAATAAPVKTGAPGKTGQR